MKLKPVAMAIDSLTKAGIPFDLFDEVRVEPTDKRFIINCIMLSAFKCAYDQLTLHLSNFILCVCVCVQ